MTRAELEHILRLRGMAYEILLWLNRKAARGQWWLSDARLEQMSYGAACEVWMRSMREQLPVNLRAEDGDLPALANLFASLLATSFTSSAVRLEWRGDLVPQLIPRSRARCDRRGHVAARQKRTVRDLARIALTTLAEEAGPTIPSGRVDAIMNDESLWNDVNLWTYACELARRSRCASQGPAVYRMWRTLDTGLRRRLNVDAIWQARERLLRAIGASEETQ